jgi:predicted MFS family arabinose efflux permease
LGVAWRSPLRFNRGMSRTTPASSSTAAIAVAGLLALAVAMGIGRFAFTPLMPLMMRDGLIDAAAGAELAAANYLGYLIGALSAVRLARAPLRLLRLALLGVVLLTLASAWAQQPPLGWLLRGGAGVCSAWVLVGASSWCLRELAVRGASRQGAWIYTGVGLGITAAGLLAWVGGVQPSQALWVELALLAAAGSAAVGWLLRRHHDAEPPAAPGPAGAARSRGHWGLVLCYGSFGFGYIVPATFLPAMARQQVDDPWVFGLAWPLFGLAAALSVAVVARGLSAWSRMQVWALAQSVMAIGAALPLFSRAPAALALAAVLVGGTFMVATMAGLQLARELQPAAPTVLLARMTSAFAVGQIAGPLLVRLATPALPGGVDAVALGSALATIALALTAAWLWREQGRHG